MNCCDLLVIVAGLRCLGRTKEVVNVRKIFLALESVGVPEKFRFLGGNKPSYEFQYQGNLSILDDGVLVSSIYLATAGA